MEELNKIISGLYAKIDNQEKIIRELQNQNIELKKQVDFQLIKISFLIERIDEVIEVLQQPMINYSSCVKALDEIEEILKGGNNE